MANLIIQENGTKRTYPAVNGEEITIQAPCDCSAVTGVQIADEVFPFYDACGKNIAGVGELFSKDSLIRILIDTVNKRAIILNRGVTPENIGAVPTSTTVNGKPLSNNIVLSASDVKAVPTTRTINSKPLSANVALNASDVGAVPTSRKVNGHVLSDDITLDADDVGARPSTWTPTASAVGAVPTSRTVNGKALSSNITLLPSDIGALDADDAHIWRGSYKGDIDDLTLNGAFWIDISKGECTGTFPSDFNQYGFLIADSRYQKLIKFGNTGVVAVWERFYTNSKWYGWRKTDATNLIWTTFTNVSTNAKITEALTTTFAEMIAGELRYIRIIVTASNLELTQTAWVVQVYKHSDTSGYAVAQTYGSNVPAQVFNSFYNGSWKGWGYTNPTCNLGTEYRTAERWKGYPVYVKSLNAGYVYAGENTIEHGCAMNQPLAIEVYNNDIEVLTGYRDITNLTCDQTSIHIHCDRDFGNITFYLKYTK